MREPASCKKYQNTVFSLHQRLLPHCNCQEMSITYGSDPIHTLSAIGIIIQRNIASEIIESGENEISHIRQHHNKMGAPAFLVFIDQLLN